MKNQTRAAYNAYTSRLATLNDVAGGAVHSTFSVDPSVQQKLEDKMQESSEFLGSINIIGVDELEGEKIGLGVSGPIASRTDTRGDKRRSTRDASAMTNTRYRCEKTNFDTHITYAKLDAWAKFKDFQTRVASAILKRQALDRIMIGFNGVKVAADTLAKETKTVTGRYEECERVMPYGVQCRQMAGVVFKSVRHTWTPVQGHDARTSAGSGFPWTRVNNCTQPAGPDFAADVSFEPKTAPAAVMFKPDQAAQIDHAWLALGACPWPRPVVDDMPTWPGPAMTTDEQRQALASWDAIKACPWPRVVPVPDKSPRHGTPRQVADWRAGRLDVTELPIDPNPTKGNAP